MFQGDGKHNILPVIEKVKRRELFFFFFPLAVALLYNNSVVHRAKEGERSFSDLALPVFPLSIFLFSHINS